MHKLLTDWKVLALDEQIKLFPQVVEIFEAAKEARRQALDAEIRGLGFKPGTVKAKTKAKYRGPNGEVWSGSHRDRPLAKSPAHKAGLFWR